jgi:hypothetical protein
MPQGAAIISGGTSPVAQEQYCLSFERAFQEFTPRGLGSAP